MTRICENWIMYNDCSFKNKCRYKHPQFSWVGMEFTTDDTMKEDKMIPVVYEPQITNDDTMKEDKMIPVVYEPQIMNDTMKEDKMIPVVYEPQITTHDTMKEDTEKIEKDQLVVKHHELAIGPFSVCWDNDGLKFKVNVMPYFYA